MGILIKMIPVSKDNSLFIYGFTDKELIFKTSYDVKQLRKEVFTIQNDVCYFGSYHVPLSHLN